MKKLFFFIMIAIFAISCEGPRGPQGIPGRDAISSMEAFNVDADKWKESFDINGNRFYYYEEKRPEITADVYDYGVPLLFYEYFVDNYGYQQILPYTRYYNDGTNSWSRTIDYEFSTGMITIYVTDSDFAEDMPDLMYFRLVIISK